MMLVARKAKATAPVPAPAGTYSRRRRPREAWSYLFVLPMIAVLGLVFVYPLITVVRDSFYGGSIGELTYVGTANYTSLIQDPVFITSLLNNLKLLATVPVTSALALGVALVLYEGVRGWRMYRVIIFLPYIIPGTAVGLSFSYLLQQQGILNTFLHDLSLGFLAFDWLGNAHLAIFSIGGVIVWTQLGFGAVVFTAALLSLPEELPEAASIDGATRWQTYRYVIIPQLRHVTEFLVVFEAITVLAWDFPYVYILTQGGPGHASSVMDLYIWQYGFELGVTGVASAASVFLLLIAGVLIFIYARLRRTKEEA